MAQADARTVALIGSADGGKTSLAEALAHAAGAIGRKGSVGEGTTVADYEAEERERKHSFQLAVLHLPRKSGAIDLIDTPGYPEFIGDAIAALTVADMAVLCLPASKTIPFHARTLWARAEGAGMPRAIAITKPDAPNVELDEVLSAVASAFGDRAVPVTLPDALGPKLTRVVDALHPPADAPAHVKDRAASALATFTERVVESDEKLMEAYLEKGEVAPDALDKAISRALVERTVYPVFFVEPIEGRGIPELLRFMESWFPTFRDRGARAASQADGKEIAVAPDPAGPFVGLVFKTVADKAVGEIHYLRILRGSLGHESQIADPRSGKPVKATGLSTVFGKERKPLDAAQAGEVVALAKVAATLEFGDTLHAAGDHAPAFHVPKPEMPKPTVSLAVEPKRREDEQKISEAVRKLVGEDPTFHWRRDPTTHELVIEGLSELHVQVQLHRLHRRFGVEVTTRLPRIAYKETIRARSEGHYRHKKQSGGRGQFGEVYCRMEPVERGGGFHFVDDVVGGSIPRQFLPAVEKGMRSVLDGGVIAGCQVIDVKVAVYEGKYHEVDSDGISFEIAGRNAFKDAFTKAKPILLEPVMTASIAVPSHFMGAITGDLNSRRGRIVGMDSFGDQTVIKAHVPLKELQQYSTQLRSVTAGEGSFSMEFSHYDPVPGNIQEQIVADWAAHHGHKAED